VNVMIPQDTNRPAFDPFCRKEFLLLDSDYVYTST